MTVRDWVKANYDDLELLTLSHAGYQPGCILAPRTREILSYAWSALDEAGDEPAWQTRTDPAQLVTGSFQHETGGRLDLKLLGLLTLSGSRSRRVSATVEVQGVQVKRFTNLPRLRLMERLRALKQPGSKVWLQIDDQTIVEECYAVERLRVTFRENGERLGKVEVERIVRPSVSAGAEARWVEEDTLEVIGKAEVPFAFRGFRL